MAIENALNNRLTRIKRSPETVFLIAICRQSGDKWQSKTLFLTIYDLRSTIVLTVPISAYPVCNMSFGLYANNNDADQSARKHKLIRRHCHAPILLVNDLCFKENVSCVHGHYQAVLNQCHQKRHLTRYRGYKKMFMLNSTEHQISTAHKN